MRVVSLKALPGRSNGERHYTLPSLLHVYLGLRLGAFAVAETDGVLAGFEVDLGPPRAGGDA